MRKPLRKSRISVLLVSAMLVCQLAGCTQPSQPNAQSSSAPEQVSSQDENATTDQNTAASSGDSYEKQSAYLKTYFDINPDQEWNSESFSAALKAVAGDEAAAVEGDFTAASAMKAAVASAAYDELAKSYPEEKAAERLKTYGMESSDSDAAAYLACGLDAGLLRAEDVKKAIAGESLTKESAADLLMAVADADGNARNFLGYSNDPHIGAKLDNMWNSFLMFDQPELTEIGKTAVQNKITTGYNLKNEQFSARFLPDLTLQYGHSDIKHAHQLMGLLNSENIVTKVQLEPKVSVFQRLLEWGPITEEPTPTFEVRKFSDDLYLTFAVEYDLQLEFENEEDMMRFDKVINTYAKKNAGNEDAIGMIYAAWWQPLYTTTREGMPEGVYYKIHDCVIKNGIYSIHPFCLDEKLDETVAQLNAINPDFKVEPVTRYCNKAFYNYMTGEDYQ